MTTPYIVTAGLGNGVLSGNIANIVTRGFSAAPADITIAVGGTAAGGLTAEEVVAGGKTIDLTLTGDTWAATLGADNAITDALIAGIDSDRAEAFGWDAVVKGNMVFGDVSRESDTLCRVTLAAEATFAITSGETITITIPASAMVVTGSPIVASPTFIVANAGTFAITAPFSVQFSEVFTNLFSSEA